MYNEREIISRIGAWKKKLCGIDGSGVFLVQGNNWKIIIKISRIATWSRIDFLNSLISHEIFFFLVLLCWSPKKCIFLSFSHFVKKKLACLSAALMRHMLASNTRSKQNSFSRCMCWEANYLSRVRIYRVSGWESEWVSHCQWWCRGWQEKEEGTSQKYSSYKSSDVHQAKIIIIANHLIPISKKQSKIILALFLFLGVLLLANILFFCLHDMNQKNYFSSSLWDFWDQWSRKILPEYFLNFLTII